jgi:hypothetical protein
MMTTATNYWIATAFAATAIAAPNFKLTTTTTTTTQEEEREECEECRGGWGDDHGMWCSACNVRLSDCGSSSSSGPEFHTLYDCDDDYEDGGVWFMCDACYTYYTPQFNNRAEADAEDFELWWWRRSQSFPYGLCVECGVGLEVETDFLVDHHDEDYAFTCNHCFQGCFGEAAFVEATTGGQIYNLRPRFTRVWGIPSDVDPMR